MTVTTTPDCLLISMLASNAAPGLARTLAKARLYKWGYMSISDDVFLVASELITNATNATPGREIKFQLSRDLGEVLVAVWDSSPNLPGSSPSTTPTLETLDLSPDHWDDNGGWGLPIVAALSTTCGCSPDPAGGKWVWSRLKT